MVEAVKPPRYVGQGAVTPESSLERALTGLEELEVVVDKYLTKDERKQVTTRMSDFKTQLTELAGNYQDRVKIEVAIKNSTALTKDVEALLSKTKVLGDVKGYMYGVRMTQRDAVIALDFRDASGHMARGLEFIKNSMSAGSAVGSTAMVSQSAASEVAPADALKHGNLQLSKGGVYRLTFDATNLQGEAHMAAGELLEAAKHQNITARVSYLMVDGKREVSIVFDGTAKAGQFLKVEPTTALFVDTAHLFSERAQRYVALGQSEQAVKDMQLANKFNPVANYTAADLPAALKSGADRIAVATEITSLQDKLSKNFHQFVELAKEGRLQFAPKGIAPIPAATTTAVVSESGALTLTKIASGGLRYFGTAGVYFSLMDGMMEATAAITDKLHQQDLQEAQKLKATADYAREHQDLKNHDACKTSELCP